MEIKEAVIVSYARTPFTRAHKGLLKDTRPDTMAAHVIKAALERAPGVKPEDIEDVVLGCAFPEGEQGMNVARVATLLAGLPDSVPAMTVNRFCSSGAQTVSQVAERIMLGQIDVGIAGGTESMTMVPMSGNKFSAGPEVMEKVPEVYTPMGTTAENVANAHGITREQMDEFALESHRRAIEAWEKGFMQEEVAPLETEVIGKDGEWEKVTAAKDDGPRPGTSLEALGKLRPAFNPKGSVTAGNASPLTDGAAAVVMMSREKAEELGLEILGTYRAFQVAGVPPEIMGIGPVPAVRKLLEKTGLTMEDIDVVELNEAFAAQAVYCAQELGIPADKLNPTGGAIAFGHPLGVSGTRMTGQLLRELERRDGRYGIVTMCIGGGMGAAMLLERT